MAKGTNCKTRKRITMKFYHTLLIKSQVNNQLKECLYDIQRNGYTSTFRMSQYYYQQSPQKRFSELRDKGYPLISNTVERVNKFGRPIRYNEYTLQFLEFDNSNFCIFEGVFYKVKDSALTIQDDFIRGQITESKQHAIFEANKHATKLYFDKKLKELQNIKHYQNAV